IRRRYSRSLKNLVVLLRIADRTIVLDNSSSRKPMKRILELREGHIVFRLQRLPRWLGNKMKRF
ncbi:MAG TPA: hypothetical protein VJ728_09210, partial [Candidatus Binataceae bacterium]|nr:hypothetical protein [Candidatus Binataceae bacterium]